MDDLAGRKALIKASRLKKGRILDIGMGDCGCMSFFLAKRGFDVIGVDYSTNAVHDSKRGAEKIKFKGSFEARLANAENLPFEAKEFAAVSAYHSMHHMDNLESVVFEMFRVCKIGGLILISDLHEKGRKAYEHEDDKGEFLRKMERILLKYTNSIRKIRTKHNMIFVCRKIRAGRKRQKGGEALPQGQLTNMICKKAYELYEKSGCKPGHDMDNWLQAERVINQKMREV